MRFKSLTILAALALLLSLPLAAQDYGTQEDQPAAAAETDPGTNLDTADQTADDQALADDMDTLPETASPLGLIALLGLGGLASAAGLRAARRK
jgi:hypothetical protein